MRNLRALAAALIPVAEAAGDAIMRVYQAEFAVERKSDDSPLTLADLESQRVILAALAQLTPDIPVLSEESAAAPWNERSQWRELWVVDPLDGTREFIKRNGEFTVNIALVSDHEPLLGVVAAPALKVLYWGAAGVGAFRRRAGLEDSIRVSPRQHPLRVVGSRSHASADTAAYLERLGERQGEPLGPHDVRGIGSSLKFCRVAEGAADLYPRFGPTSEWDTAAGQALLEAAGGAVVRLDGHRLRYNCRESLINGDFLACGGPGVLEAAVIPP